MVKRPKSPETNEEERYFIVYQPYPLNANWEVPADYIQFIQWIAACIGTDAIHALHYKPSAGSMVIIEVDKKYQHHQRLLGEHRWKEFLKQPSEDEMDSVSQIFYCLYNTGREAQKDGWKRIHVESPWFKDWEPTKTFRDPYPMTHWCNTPAEDRTNKSLCRPLPVGDLPPPGPTPKRIPLVVGSETWASAKTGSSSSKFQQPATRGKKNGKAKQPNVNTDHVGVASTPSPSPASSSHWNKPILQPTAQPAQPKPSSSASLASPSAPPNAWAKHLTQRTPIIPASEPPVLPPGLSIQRTIGHSLAAPPGLTQPSLSNGTSSSGSASVSSWEGQENKTDDKSLDVLFHDSVVIRAPQDTASTIRPEVDDGESGDDEDVIQPWEGDTSEHAPGNESNANFPTPASQNSNDPVDLWGDETGLAQRPAVAKCPYHGQLCKKGVCGWRAKQVKEEEKLEKLGKAIDEGSRGRGQRGNGRRQSRGAHDNGAADGGFATVGSRDRGRRR